MKLVVIDGLSGTGKTTVARHLSREMNCVFFSKDLYKEQLFDQLGKNPSLHQWVRIDKQSWQKLYDKIAELLDTNATFIVEGDFKRGHIAKVKEIIRDDTKVVELFCFADGFVPLKRYIRRNRSGERHRGHRDHLWYFAVLATVIIDKLGIKICGPFELRSTVMKIDTTNFDSIRYDEILQHIRR